MHVMVMDNVLFHKSVHIHALITSTGATLLFLPSYSPDLNPIEHDCTTLKYLREYNEQDSLGTIDKMYK
jgi:putative transposase